MLLAVDIGNSSINIGYFTDRGLLAQQIATKPLRTAREYSSKMRDFLFQNNLEKGDFSSIICSVVPGHTEVFEEAVGNVTGQAQKDITIVSSMVNSGLHFNVRFPDKVGADRIADAAAAYERYKGAAAVVDFGTATTLTVVDGSANFIGGAILPGLALMNEATGRGAAGLMEVSLDPPDEALGRDTDACLRSGLFYGTAGAAERILDEIESETGIEFSVIITGGFCGLMERFVKRHHDADPYLTLKGLKVIHGKNECS